MGLWNDHVFVPVMDRGLRTPEVNARRAKLCEGLHGRVLEIGDRPIDDLISNAGLIIRELETGYGQGPRPFSYLYRGWAQPQSAS